MSSPPPPPRADPGAAPRDPRLLLAVLVGGFCGTVLRAGLADRWPHDPTQWPWATFAVNVLGAALLGAIVARQGLRPRGSRYVRPLLGTGLCGGLTTFSTMQLELLRMLDADALALALGYAAASVAAGIAAVLLGGAALRRVVGDR